MFGAWLIRPSLDLTALSLRALLEVVDAARAGLAGPVAGRCPVCGQAVLVTEPHLLHRGVAYHAEPCAETHPPAESRSGESAPANP
jgi:hypothetical protein